MLLKQHTKLIGESFMCSAPPQAKINEETRPCSLEKLQLPSIIILIKSLNYTFSK